MQLVIELPERAEQIAFNAKRWQEVLADTSLASLPHPIETNATGQIIVNPPPSGQHSYLQGQVIVQLNTLLGNIVLPECPISTIDGVRAADVGWYSVERFEQVKNQLAFEIAPEICVEILSPSSTPAEIKHKKMLYFEAGAEEVWLVESKTDIVHYMAAAPSECVKSRLCPDFEIG